MKLLYLATINQSFVIKGISTVFHDYYYLYNCHFTDARIDVPHFDIAAQLYMLHRSLSLSFKFYIYFHIVCVNNL